VSPLAVPLFEAYRCGVTSRISAPELIAYSRSDHPLAGRYQIERDIGAGGMAMVFAARDLKHDRRVAIKVLRSDVASAVNAERFTREIQIAAKLTHPHILPIHDSGTVDGILFYVMPFVEGETLGDRISRGGPLPVAEAVHIAQEIAGALQYAHERGVVHRDVKPANVLLPGGEAVVADFGLARALEGDSGLERLTQVGLGIGTPAYMSPEQGSGERNVDTRSDQYSLACIVYEMLVGHPPFMGQTFQSLLAQHMTEPPVPVRRTRPEVPRGVDEAVMRALAKDPAARFPSVAEFGRAVERGLNETSTSWRVVSDAWQSSVLSRRGLAIGGVAIVVAAAVAGGRWLSRRAGSDLPPVDANLVAVTPFNVIGSSLEVWKEGLVDVLARDFDGAGPLRSVSPSVLMRNFQGHTDRATAASLAKATGAGLVLYGQLIERGADSARASVTLLDVIQDSVVADFEVRDAVAQMDRMADSIAVQSLRLLGNRRSIAAVPKTFFGSRSLPALKVFLRGEQFYRQNDFSSARTAYEQAITLDTNFALAYRRMRGVLRGINGEFDTLSLRYAVRAGDHNHGMTPRDSLLILADSLAAAHINPGPSYASGEWLGSVRRRISVLEEASKRYGEDPEVWTELGEARVHYGDRVGVDAVTALQPFERALAIDSLYGPAFFHAIELSIRLRSRQRALALVERYTRVNPRDSAYIFVADALRGDKTDKIVRDYVAVVARSVGGQLAMLGRLADDPDVFLALQPSRLAAMKRRSDSLFARVGTVQRLILRGRLRAAYAASDSTVFTVTSGIPHALVLAVAGAMPRAAADSFFARLASDSTFVWRPLSYAWWYHSGNTVALRRAAELPDLGSVKSTDAQALAAYAKGIAGTYLSLAQHDTSGALRAFRQVGDSSVGRWLAPIRNDIARVLLARRDYRGAAELLDSRPTPASSLYFWNIEWNLLRARAAVGLGEQQRARELYGTVAAMWSKADPELRPNVAEAQSGMR